LIFAVYSASIFCAAGFDWALTPTAAQHAETSNAAMVFFINSSNPNPRS
jgi:hypothetical protein